MSKKILVVDDDEEILVFLKTFLESKGYDVYIAANARDGLRIAKMTPPDLIVLDVMMPNAGGLTAYKSLREARGADMPIPIVIFSAAPVFLIEGKEGLTKSDIVKKSENVPELLEAIERKLGAK